MIRIGNPSVSLEDILTTVSELDILNYYFKIDNIPCIISSPLRLDNHPSFGLYSIDGKKIHWTDLATKDRGGVFDLLGKYWEKSYSDVLIHIFNDLPNITKTNICNITTSKSKIISTKEYVSNIDLQCKVREWKQHDLEYWQSFGINIKWLKYADIYPISHKIIIKEDRKMVFTADKYAYAYVEFKEGNVTLKIYQPFNKKYKWSNRHDRSVISLWTKVPEYGDKICICSSMKDALCLWANTGIPAIAIQGEGYVISETAIYELKRRYKEVFILLDNDNVGLTDGKKLSEQTGFTNLVLPYFKGGKDISDLMKVAGRDIFLKTVLPLFNSKKELE